jgi:hypothetical protein
MNPAHTGRVGERGNIKSREKGFASSDSENPFINIKRTFEVIDNKRQQEEILREKGPVFGEEINFEKQMRQLRKEIDTAQSQLVN